MEEHGPRASTSIDEETLWQLNLRENECVENGSYPKRPGKPDCSHYMQTGLCRFGMTCRFNHPPNRKLYYVKTGNCKFGATCKFHHPKDGAGITGSVQLNSFCYPLHPGQLGSESSPENQQATKSETTQKTQGTFSSYISGSVPLDQHAVQKDNILPERSDQPECQFYMKTGDCKFGAICRFHHPKERFLPAPGFVLTPLGLPLRSGEPLCVFYSHYGIFKFGPNCKFDHLMETSMRGLAYSLPTSSSLAVPPVQRLLGSSMSPRSGSRQITSEDENIVRFINVWDVKMNFALETKLPDAGGVQFSVMVEAFVIGYATLQEDFDSNLFLISA